MPCSNIRYLEIDVFITLRETQKIKSQLATNLSTEQLHLELALRILSLRLVLPLGFSQQCNKVGKPQQKALFRIGGSVIGTILSVVVPYVIGQLLKKK